MGLKVKNPHPQPLSRGRGEQEGHAGAEAHWFDTGAFEISRNALASGFFAKTVG
jgi:hypothetical protein